jgi:quercetin dioxygenase-like cupin family protein
MEITEKPWGFEKLWAHTEDYVGKILFIKAGHRLSKQYHEKKEETIYVLRGTLHVYDENDKIIKVNPGGRFHVEPGQIHRFGATHSSVELVEVSTNYLDDVVRLEDDYRRE